MIPDWERTMLISFLLSDIKKEKESYERI